MLRTTTLGTILGVALLLVGSAAIGLGATGGAAPAADAAPALQDENETTGNETMDNETADNVTVGDEAATENATAVFLNQTSNGSAVLVNETSLPEGGFIAIHLANKSSPGNFSVGPVIGNSSFLESGESEDVTVALDESLEESQWLIAMPHMDTNDNQQYEFPEADDPYTVDGPVPVTDEAYVEVMPDAPLEVTEEVEVTNVTVENETDAGMVENETEEEMVENETEEGMGNETADNETGY